MRIYSLLLIPAAVLAQPSAPLKLGDVTVQGSIRTRFEGWDWFGSGAHSVYGYSGTMVRISFS